MNPFPSPVPARSSPVPDAVILAAGNGSRLRATWTSPKPVQPVDGRPLLARVIDLLQAAGCVRVHVVVGYGAEAVRRCPGAARAGVDLRWIDNARYQEANGLSLLAAREAVTQPFLLVMGDHLFDAATVSAFARLAPPTDGGLLAVDPRLSAVFDVDDATRVLEEDGVIRAIAKGLARYNAVDTGLFQLSPAVFAAMDESVRDKDASLTGGIARLAARGAMGAWNIGAGHWIDVDTAESAREAERLVRAGLVGIVR